MWALAKLVAGERFVFQSGGRSTGDGTNGAWKKERWCATRSRREIQVGRCWGVRKRVERRRGRVEYDKTSIPLMETNPPLRAPSPSRRAGRQFVRVYPTYPDISTLRPGGGLGSQSSTDLSLAFSYSTLPSLLPNLHATHLLFDFSFIFSLPFIHFYPRFRLGFSFSPRSPLFSSLLSCYSFLFLSFAVSFITSSFFSVCTALTLTA